LSILLTAAAITGVILFALWTSPNARFGWIGEKFVWLYIGTLWIGGAKVWLGTLRPVAEVGAATITLRPLHNLRQKTIAWERILGTEQMIGGDRLMLFHDTPRGMRSVALNLNLVKGRREFLKLLDGRLAAMGFVEKVVERSRYRSRPRQTDT
jgi:hypothetical protein